MIKINRATFENNIVAQDDDCDYSESGYVVFVVDDIYYIANYSHCSCYGTWEAISGFDDYYYGEDNVDLPEREINTIWSGTRADLLFLAKNKRDPSMPEREANKNDYDYDHLMNIYRQITTE
jgi:hypothetical protein